MSGESWVHLLLRKMWRYTGGQETLRLALTHGSSGEASPALIHSLCPRILITWESTSLSHPSFASQAFLPFCLLPLPTRPQTLRRPADSLHSTSPLLDPRNLSLSLILFFGASRVAGLQGALESPSAELCQSPEHR